MNCISASPAAAVALPDRITEAADAIVVSDLLSSAYVPARVIITDATHVLDIGIWIATVVNMSFRPL